MAWFPGPAVRSGRASAVKDTNVRYATENQSGPLSTVLLGAGALAVGVGVPLYVSEFGESTAAMFALPMLLLLAALFVVNRTWLLLLILVTRAAADVVLESTRSSGIGAGALINAAVIMLTMTLVFEKPKAAPGKMLAAWAAFFLTSLYGIALAPEKGEAVRLCLTWLSNLAVFVAAFHVVRSAEDFRFFIRLILWSSALPALYALYDIAANAPAAGMEFRLQSTFTHANILAFYLMLVIALGFYMVRSRPQGQPVRYTLLSFYLLFLTGLLILTQTRSAWFACFGMLLAYGLLFERRYLLYLVLLFGVAMLIPVVRERIVDLGSGNEVVHQAKLNSFAWRVALWESGLAWMEPLRYIFGYGIGSFREYAPVFFPLGDGIRWDAHNVYVQWFFDVGAIGLAAYLWIHARLLYLLRPLFTFDRLLGFIIFALVASYLFVSFSDNMMFYLAFNWYFWFTVGAACALVHAYRLSESPEHERRRGMPQRPQPRRARA